MSEATKASNSANPKKRKRQQEPEDQQQKTDPIIERVERYVHRNIRGVKSFQVTGQPGTSTIIFGGRKIDLTLTTKAKEIKSWIRKQGHQQIYGLDLEWKPKFHAGGSDNKTALLQLCNGNACLIVQMLYLDKVPKRLKTLLKNPEVKLVGVGVEGDAARLRKDYGLECNGAVELGPVAATSSGDDGMKHCGLSALSRIVIGLEMHKSKNITMSDWSKSSLSSRQVEYACIDAFVSFAIGKKLLEPDSEWI